MTKLTVNGNTYSDDGSTPNDMGVGGYRKYLMAMLSDTLISIATSLGVLSSSVVTAQQQALAAAASAATAVNAPGTNATSTTALTIAKQVQNLVIQAGKQIVGGMQVIIADTAAPTNWMAGTVTNYSPVTGALSVNITASSGTAVNVSTWTVSLSGVPGVIGVVNEQLGAAIASAATVNLDGTTGNTIHITGNTPIATITLAPGARRTVIFDGTPLLIHNAASIVCPGLQSIQVNAGDKAILTGDAGGVVQVIDFVRANGQAVSTPALIPINGLLALDTDMANASGNVFTDPFGAIYLKTGVIAAASAYPSANAAPWVSGVTNSSTPPALGTLQSLAYGNNVWLAGATTGRIYASADGMVWGAPTQLTGMTGSVTLAFANGMFVAVDSATKVVAKSVDGANWTYGVMPSAGNWLALAYGAGVWVAAQAGTQNIATSTDGVTWVPQVTGRTWATPGVNTFGNSGLVFGNGIFVLVDQSGAAATAVSSSADGVNWTTRTLAVPSSRWVNVAFGNGVFVISMSSSTYGVQTSTDGATWTPRAPLAASAVQVIAFIGGLFVTNSTVGLMTTSPDGTNWTAQQAGTTACSSHLALFASNGTYHIACLPVSANSFVRSDNALSWGFIGASAGVLSGGQFNYNGTKYFFNNAVGSATQAALCLSSNGTSWWQAMMPTADIWTSSTYFAGLYVVRGSSSLYTSPDAVSWTARTAIGSYAGPFCIAGPKLFALSGAANANFTASTNGTSFVPGTFAALNSCVNVVYGNGTYLAHDQTSVVNTSLDGVSWVSRPTAFAGTITKIVFASGYFICVTSAGNWYSSPDGITWTLMTNGFGLKIAATYVVTDGVQVLAFDGANAMAAWPGTGTSYYNRALANSAMGILNLYSIGFAGAQLYSINNSGSSYIASVSSKVLNDTNIAAGAATFYKRVA